MLTAAQLEMRKLGIGASEIGAVMGVNPFTAPIDIYLPVRPSARRTTSRQTLAASSSP